MSLFNNAPVHQQEVARMTEIRYVFHPWINIPILGNDGAMFNLDTRLLDTNVEGGVGFLPRLRLLPIISSQKPVINNKDGFSVVNLFIGDRDSGDHVTGKKIGAGLAGATRTNVKSDWVYPSQIVGEMCHTFGKWGLIGIESLYAASETEHQRNQDIFDVVFSGWHPLALLEDLPEYFGEFSPFLPQKPKAQLRATAQQQALKALQEGIELGTESAPRFIKFSDRDFEAASRLIEQITVSVQMSHTAALDPETDGILAKTREGMQTGQKKSYDKCDQWLMQQFPSYPMDTTLEKSNAQILKVLNADGGQSEAAAPQTLGVPVDVYLAEKQRNDELSDRLARLEGQISAQPQPAPATTAAKTK